MGIPIFIFNTYNWGTFACVYMELVSSPLIQYSCHLSELLQLYTCKLNWNKMAESKFLLVL